MGKFLKSKTILKVLITSIFSTLACAGIIYAASTIGANISTTGDLTVDTNTLYVDSTNNRVGIGTITPDSDFHLYKSGGSTSKFESSGDTELYIKSGLNGVSRIRLASTTSSGWTINNNSGLSDLLSIANATEDLLILTSTSNIGIKDSSPDATLEVNGTFMVSNGGSGDGDRFIVNSSGDIGIGTTTPQYKLDVNGNVNIDLSSTYKINGETILFASTTRNNIFVGDDSGSLSISGGGNSFLGYQSGTNTTSGQLNTFVGESAGNNNISGSYNDFFGSSAGLYNTLGSSNTFIGTTAGYSNISGSSNAFLGGGAGYQHTSGDNNTFIGNNAGYNNNSGSGNVFLGYRAGYNASSTNKLYISNSETSASSTLIYGEFDNNIGSRLDT